ncbi:MAG: DUF2332 domain-containing protein [Sandaracinobacter sp.]
MMQGPTSAPESPFREHARWQAHWCTALGSPFTALLCTLVADRLDPAIPLARRLDAWPGNPQDDALMLRITGGLHALVRSGKAPTLAALYPPAPAPDPDALWAALAPVLAGKAILPWLDSAPQTNEVARSGVLVPGFLTIAAETGLPLALLELGCSAGLNLVPDRYAYRLGTLEAGNPDSCLRIEPVWEGAAPPAVPLKIASRAGVDLNPLDLLSPDARNRLLAYVWPDQPQRLERMARAIAITAEDMPEIVQGDAADFVETRVETRKGVTTTVFHSIAFQYFPPETQARIEAHMEQAAASATRAAPLAWLRFELEPGADSGVPPSLRLRLWPGGEDRLLARAHPHGKLVQWLA